MLDPVQLPILMKAIDFVFDEGRKILEERREHRKNDDKAQDNNDHESANAAAPPVVQDATESKQGLFSVKIEEKLWQANEKEIEHLVRLLEKHTGVYYTLKEQYAEFGSLMAPPHILSQMKEKENLIIETKKQLESALSRVYKKDINLVK
ncbi:MAG: hypothetical protein ABI986_00220 [Chloroflexota bacterium]